MKPSPARQSSRRGNRPGKSRPRRPLPSPQPQKHPRLTAARKVVKASGPAVTAVLALAAIVISIAAYANQRAANAAQRRVDQAAATAALRHDAAQVSYWLQGVPHSSSSLLMVENRSGGPIRGIELYLPEPVKGCAAPCHTKGGIWGTLPDLPACSIESTTLVKDIISPKIGPDTLAKSALTFVDENGVHWTRMGSGELHLHARYHGVSSWYPAGEVKPAHGCS